MSLHYEEFTKTKSKRVTRGATSSQLDSTDAKILPNLPKKSHSTAKVEKQSLVPMLSNCPYHIIAKLTLKKLDQNSEINVSFS